jgi:hypothetical protein
MANELVNLQFILSVIDELQSTQPIVVNRNLPSNSYPTNLLINYNPGTLINSGTPVNQFVGIAVPVLYVRNASPNGVLNCGILFNGAMGGILTSALFGFGGGSGYAVGDTGIILGPNNNATYIINSVSGGAVVTYTITFGGSGYSVSPRNSTTTGGAQPGVGTGFAIVINSVGNSNTEQLVTLGPGGIFMYFQPQLDPAGDNTINTLALASQNGGNVVAEILYAQ